MNDEDFADEPEQGDFHGHKRELLRLGKEKGELTWQEIQTALPPEYLSDTELEVFLFTCENMGIAIKDRPKSKT